MEILGFHHVILSFAQAILYFPSAVSHPFLRSNKNASPADIPLG